MANRLQIYITALLMIFMLSNCRHAPQSKEELTRYIYDENHGPSITKNTEVFRLNLTYLPSEWRIFSEDTSNGNRDSLMAKLDKSLLFLFRISPQEGKTEGDVFLSGVTNKQQYEERVRKANFGFADSWSLLLDDGKELSPAGVQMEQTNGLNEDRKFFILFDVSQIPEVHSSKAWDLKLNDDVFNSGIHHFVYETSNIGKISKRTK